MRKQMKGMGFYLGFIVILIAAMLLSDSLYSINKEIYNEALFQEDLKNGQISAVEIYQNQTAPTGEIQAVFGTGEKQKTKTFYVSDVELVLDQLREENFTNYYIHDVEKQGWLVTILPYILGFALVFILLMFMTNQAGAGGGGNKMMNFGKSRAKMSNDKDRKVTFNNVAGLHEEKEELEEIVDFLKNPRKYTDVGARIPKGVILTGLRERVRRCLPRR